MGACISSSKEVRKNDLYPESGYSKHMTGRKEILASYIEEDSEIMYGDCAKKKEICSSHPVFDHQSTIRALELSHIDYVGSTKVESIGDKGVKGADDKSD